MLAIVHIRNNETGEIRDYATELLENINGKPGPWLWQWQEDGYSCDCNRAIFWGEEWQDEYFRPACCVEGGYNVQIVEAGTGKVLYDEFERPFQSALRERNARIRAELLIYRKDAPTAGQAWLDAHPVSAKEE